MGINWREHLEFELGCNLLSPIFLKISEDGSPWELSSIDSFAIDSEIHENGELVVEKLMYGYAPGRSAEIVCEKGNASFGSLYGDKEKVELENCPVYYQRKN